MRAAQPGFRAFRANPTSPWLDPGFPPETVIPLISGDFRRPGKFPELLEFRHTVVVIPFWLLLNGVTSVSASFWGYHAALHQASIPLPPLLAA
jgi:hypothetical protein